METCPIGDGRVLENADFGDPTGSLVIYLHGTPNTAGSAVFWDAAARRQRFRLVAMSRPGYGASTLTPPGLGAVGRDVADLATALGHEQYAVVGVSGGGPYALAAAAKAPERVQAVVVVAGPGCWRDVAPDVLAPEDREAIALMGAGDADGAVAVVTDGVTRDLGHVRDLPPAEFVAAMSAVVPPGEPEFFVPGSEEQHEFHADMRRALATFDGFVRDNISFNGPWDIDLADVRAPVLLSYGVEDHMVPLVHSEWLAARLPSARVTVHPDAGHGKVCLGMPDWHLQAIREQAGPPAGA